MKISTKGRYGLKAMLDIAINSEGDKVTLKSIAERQNISEGYLEQVFSSLRKGGLVKSIKGAQGGYMLSKSVSSITVGDILRVLEGDLSIVDDGEGEGSQDHIEYCIRSNVWRRINQSINNTVDSITLEYLVIDYRKNRENDAFAYYI